MYDPFPRLLELPSDNVKQFLLVFINCYTDSLYSGASENASIIVLPHQKPSPIIATGKAEELSPSFLLNTQKVSKYGWSTLCIALGRKKSEEAEMEALEWENPGWSPF